MMTVEWVFRGVVIVLLVWSLWALYNERTKRRTAGEQVPTWDELAKWCAGQRSACDKYVTPDKCEACNDKRDKERDTEMNHVKEVIQQKLDQGERRFNEIKTEQKETTTALHDLTIQIKLLQQKLDGFREAANKIGG